MSNINNPEQEAGLSKKVSVRIPTVLRYITGGVNPVQIEAEQQTVGGVIEQIDEQYPGFKAKILDGEGQLNRHINIFLGPENIRDLGGLATSLNTDVSELSIIPAVAGG